MRINLLAVLSSCIVLIIKSSSGQATPASHPFEAFIRDEVKRQMGQMFNRELMKQELMRELQKELETKVKIPLTEEIEATKQVQHVVMGDIEKVKLTLSSLQEKYMKQLYKKLEQLETKCGRCHQGTIAEPAGWSLWGSWTRCGSSCGSGIRSRSRACNNPTMQGTCQGEAVESQQCQGHDCTVWGPWQSWSECNVECGEGTFSRSRTCLGGTTCHDTGKESRSCRQKPCAVWLSWGQWSSCTASCGTGSRSRECSSNTDPNNYAGKCEGSNSETKSCNSDQCPTLHRLSQPVMELNLTRTSPQLTSIQRVAALPGGEAVLYNYVSSNKTGQVIKIDQNGQPVQHLYSCVTCTDNTGLLELGEDIFIIYRNGTVVCVNQDGRVDHVYHIQNVTYVNHRGSLSSNPAQIVDKDLLLLVDESKGEVFTYRLSTEQKVVRLTGLLGPRSVSYLYTQQAVYYVVCERGSHTVSVYNSSWSRVSTMGRSSNVTLSLPYAAITSLEQTILVADYNNNRIIEFSKEGELIRHLISVHRPRALSISFPHVWVISQDSKDKLYRYRIYKT